MVNMIKSALVLGFAAAVATATLSAAKADILRVAIVEAENDADFNANAALLPALADILKKGGAKSVTVGTDAEHKAIATSTVWASAADLAKVTGSDQWKAEAGKLKRKSYTTEVFTVGP
jgi:hypothetical protein